jgi:hypothetical protein
VQSVALSTWLNLWTTALKSTLYKYSDRQQNCTFRLEQISATQVSLSLNRGVIVREDFSMTPLERAKAFVQSRAAKTALKILPLALATVVSAHAGTAKFTLSGDPVWNAPGSSTGGFLVLTNSTSTGSEIGFGVTGSGFTDMQVMGNSGDDTSASFSMSGGGTGNFGASPVITVSWDFNITCDQDCKNGQDAGAQFFIYDVLVNINGNVYESGAVQFLGDPSGSFVITDPNLVNQDLTSWSAEVDLIWHGGNIFDTGTWTQNFLTIQPNTTATPEPATLFMAFAGLPFVIRLTRKKQ